MRRPIIPAFLWIVILLTISCAFEETSSGPSGNPPAAPTELAVSVGDGQVTVQWKTVAGASSYNLYWSQTQGTSPAKGTKIAKVSSPYVHESLANGATYYYIVTAVNDNGESGKSNEAAVTLNDAPPEPVGVTATPLVDLDNARIRIVWVQEMGSGSDVDARGGNLRLMGLDTFDGQGERVISGTVGNYSKPLISPRGDRVVYTNRIRKKVCVVNWDGSGLRELFGGFGLALWRDPRDGREWIYYGLEEKDDGHCPAVYRTPLDSSGSGELVWNRTLVGVDSFQLSADGQMAGGIFPWPGGGVAQLPNQSWTRLGSGCWASLAPDNSYAFWILDGQHRNLFVTDVSGLYGRWVNINGAPGIDGYEIYHPRWSNHPRMMAMTGPYKVGSGENRIAGGGREVEIYLGRFNADFTAVESWRRVTNNNLGDFFPDVWVSP